MRAWSLLSLLTPFAAGLAFAAGPVGSSDALIRISGSPADRTLIMALERGFAAVHPEARFRTSLYGPESTLAGVYTGTADVAFMPREMREPMERMAYEWAMLQPPLVTDYAMGGLTAHRPATQLGIFLHPSNPVASLSLNDLDALYGAEHKRALSMARFWGEVGAGGAWRTRPVHVVGPAVDSTDALFFRRLVLKDSRKWNPDYRELAPAAALDIVRRDPSAIAFAPLDTPHNGLKLVPVAGALPDEANVRSGAYPLARRISLVVAHDKGQPVQPRLRDFVDFVLSDGGQRIVAADGAYLALDPKAAAEQRNRLAAAR